MVVVEAAVHVDRSGSRKSNVVVCVAVGVVPAVVAIGVVAVVVSNSRGGEGEGGETLVSASTV